MTRKTPIRGRKQESRALVPVTDALPAGIQPTAGVLIVRDGDTVLVSGAAYGIQDRMIPSAEVFYVEGLKGEADGQWMGEADKLAWRDEATGYECIIMRAERGGHLCGYVGVPVDHPLHGFGEDAIPAGLDIEVHGGLTYGRRCQHGPNPRGGASVEARLVCHVARTPPPPRPIRHATEYKVEDEDAWWLGFSCNHLYDLMPNDERRPKFFLEREVGRVYRDEGYVHDQVLNLAAQLKAIAEGRSKPALIGATPPPIGLEPREAR